MAKYEVNRAGRALKRTITSKPGSGKSRRAKETLNKYSSKYSNKQIADAASRSAKRANEFNKSLKSITISSILGGLAAASVYALAGPAGAAMLSTSITTAAASSATTIGDQALTNSNERNIDTKYNEVQSAIKRYRKYGLNAALDANQI